MMNIVYCKLTRALQPLLILALTMNCNPVLAKGVYLTTEQFLEIAFNDKEQPPSLKKYWLNSEDKQFFEAMFAREPSLRIRYWLSENRTAWIIEEIGKTEPITIGAVIENAEILQIEILAFRESRGWEVKHPFFKNQFQSISLSKSDKSYALSKSIDGITGATLSVNAVKKVATMALYLHAKVTADGE